MEALRLRVKDIDFDRRCLMVRETKSNRDRATCVPDCLVDPLRLQLATVKAQHDLDLSRGHGAVELPHALEKKYPGASRELKWRFVFPSPRLSKDPRGTGIRRHPLYPTGIERAVAKAAQTVGIQKPA